MKHLFLSPRRNKVQLIRSEIVEGEVVGIGCVEGEIDFTHGDVEITVSRAILRICKLRLGPERENK
ncbi:MAG: hypothetical protein QOJ51_1694 [Acidobacteriaceae bacterium]|jgi:hypothetical protein|nr:hypothetical protein [Acidobacteriaceae bacterium]MEA2258869.1 hypothetical protein [Acidobacteriaceae bacterium]